MKTIFITGVRLKMLNAIKDANEKGRFIDSFELDLEEYKALKEECCCPPNKEMYTFNNIPLTWPQSKVVGIDGKTH